MGEDRVLVAAAAANPLFDSNLNGFNNVETRQVGVIAAGIKREKATGNFPNSDVVAYIASEAYVSILGGMVSPMACDVRDL